MAEKFSQKYWDEMTKEVKRVLSLLDNVDEVDILTDKDCKNVGFANAEDFKHIEAFRDRINKFVEKNASSLDKTNKEDKLILENIKKHLIECYLLKKDLGNNYAE